MKAFALQDSEVLHDRGLTRQAEMALDFTRAWRDPFFALFALNEFEDVALPLSQHGAKLRYAQRICKFK